MKGIEMDKLAEDMTGDDLGGSIPPAEAPWTHDLGWVGDGDGAHVLMQTAAAAPASDDLVERVQSRINWLSGHVVKGSLPRYDGHDGPKSDLSLLVDISARIISAAATIKGLRAMLSAISMACPRPVGMSVIDAIKAEQEDARRLHREKMEEWQKRYDAETALRAIIARADNNEPGTSKVQDMKQIAVEALGP